MGHASNIKLSNNLDKIRNKVDKILNKDKKTLTSKSKLINILVKIFKKLITTAWFQMFNKNLSLIRESFNSFEDIDSIFERIKNSTNTLENDINIELSYNYNFNKEYDKNINQKNNDINIYT